MYNFFQYKIKPMHNKSFISKLFFILLFGILLNKPNTFIRKSSRPRCVTKN